MYGLLSLNINDIMVYLCIQDINQIGFLQHNKIVESVKETESIFVGTPKCVEIPILVQHPFRLFGLNCFFNSFVQFHFFKICPR